MTVAASTAGECPDVRIASVVDGSAAAAAAAATAETRVSTAEPILLELFNPIADADEIIYDSSKECAGDDVDMGAAASEHDTANGHGTDEPSVGSGTASAEHRTSPLSPTAASPASSPAANHSFLSLVLRAMGGCLLRPRRRSNESVTSAPPGKGPNVPHLSPKRKGIRGRLQLIQSRSSSSDNSDPVTATTSVGERNLSSGGSGDSADKSSVGRSSKVVAHTNEYCEGGFASEAYNVSYHELDDDTLDGASYAFSQAAGISEEAKVEVDIGSVVARIGVDLGNANTEGGNDAISILFDDEDEDEAGDDLLAISVGDGENDECGSSESPSISENNPADELDYIRPLFTHQSLRQASEKRTSYDFVIDEDESDECLCKVSQVDVDSTSQQNEE